jgi:hypothetical protein
VHELAHGLTRSTVNAQYGEAPRMGRLGHQRTTNDALRAVHWEWLVAHKQRELNGKMGLHTDEHNFNREVNTVMHDAVYRAVTGKFTNPDQEGFHPSHEKVPLETSLDMVRAHAKRLGLHDHHATLGSQGG